MVYIDSCKIISKTIGGVISKQRFYSKASRGAKIQENLGFVLHSHGLYWFMRKHKQINRRGYIKINFFCLSKPGRKNPEIQQHKPSIIRNTTRTIRNGGLDKKWQDHKQNNRRGYEKTRCNLAFSFWIKTIHFLTLILWHKQIIRNATSIIRNDGLEKSNHEI